MNKHKNMKNKKYNTYLITVADGMLIAYIYLFRSNNFVNMQTGNLVKFVVDLSRGVFSYSYLVCILSFFVALMAGFFISKHKKNNLLNIGIEIALLIPSIFLPTAGEWNLLSLALFSAFFGLQFGNYEFGKIDKEIVTTNMMTNNMRLFSQSLGGAVLGEVASWKKVLLYFVYILCFCAGVSATTLLSSLMSVYVVIVPTCLLSIIFILYL